MKGLFIFAVQIFGEIIEWSMILRAILSWFVRSPYGFWGKIYQITINLSEPIVGPIRDFLNKKGANNGGVDWSLLVAFLLWQVLISVVTRLIYII